MRSRADLDQRPHGVAVGRLRARQHFGGQHTLRQVVAAFEGGVAARGRDLAGEEQVLQHALGDRPVPPPPGTLARVLGLVLHLHLAGGHRAALAHQLAHLGHDRGVPHRHLRDQPPRLVPVRASTPPQQRVGRRRDVGRLVRPRLHEPSRRPPRRAVQQPDVVGPDARERRHEMGAGQHVHRVDLHDAEAVDDLLQRAHPATTGAAAPVQSLGAERDSTGLRQAQLFRHPDILAPPTDTPARARRHGRRRGGPDGPPLRRRCGTRPYTARAEGAFTGVSSRMTP